MRFLVTLSRAAQVLAVLIFASLLGEYLSAPNDPLVGLFVPYLVLSELIPLVLIAVVHGIAKVVYGTTPNATGDILITKQKYWLIASILLFLVTLWLSYNY